MEIESAGRLARGLMARHGLLGWSLVFDNAKTRAGICRQDRRQIGLSRVLTALHDEAEVRDTVLHEIAHALVGVEHGHDEVWRAQARRIGCTGRRCVPESAPTVPGRWRGLCPVGHEFTRHKRPVRVLSCGLCSRGFDPTRLLHWLYDGREVPMHPRYVAELAGLTAGLGGHVGLPDVRRGGRAARG
ncbi:SprT-like domain-containing protein [Spongisporangium articulatum]|uniref:SprT-like domain-containing protein n=1 Tax=Spongisporangium articulatum TaxID=3362603 RepID=A0ABW8AL59_9ACTN